MTPAAFGCRPVALTSILWLPPPPSGVNVTLSVAQLDATEVEVQVSCAETAVASTNGTREVKRRFMVFCGRRHASFPWGRGSRRRSSDVQATAGSTWKALARALISHQRQKGDKQKFAQPEPEVVAVGSLPARLRSPKLHEPRHLHRLASLVAWPAPGFTQQPKIVGGRRSSDTLAEKATSTPVS